MRPSPRIALIVAGLLWLGGLGALVLPAAGLRVAVGLLATGILVAVGAAVLSLRALHARVGEVAHRNAQIARAVRTLADPGLPSSSTDWAPRAAADPAGVAAIVALAARLDLGAVGRAGSVDHGALADVIAEIDRLGVDAVVVHEAPAEALGLALATAGHGTPRVTAVVAREEDAAGLRLELARLDAADRERVTVVAEAPRAVARAAYLAGPSWARGADVRTAAADAAVADPAVDAVLVPAPRTIESQGLTRRLLDAGFVVDRETSSVVVLRRGAAAS